MITIQLAPPSELEDKLWFIPDVTILVLITAISWWGIINYMDTLKQEVDDLVDEKIKLVDSTKRLSADLKRYDEMNVKIKDLENKILSLNSITSSATSRFKSVILLEHLQNLKPEGVWFHALKDDSEKGLIYLKAGAFDHLLVAEFMTSLTSTKFQEADPSNPRTQIFFSELDLEKIAVKGSDSSSKGPGNQGQNTGKNAEIQAAFNAAQKSDFKDEGIGSSVTSDSEKLYPELSDFPIFELKIKYEERKVEENKQKPIAMLK